LFARNRTTMPARLHRLPPLGGGIKGGGTRHPLSACGPTPTRLPPPSPQGGGRCGTVLRLYFPQVIALRLRQILVADLAQRAALAGILDAGPHQPRIEIVAAIGVDRA